MHDQTSSVLVSLELRAPPHTVHFISFLGNLLTQRFRTFQLVCVCVTGDNFSQTFTTLDGRVLCV